MAMNVEGKHRNQDSDQEQSTVPENKKKKTGGWKTFPFIIGNEVCSYAAGTGLRGNIIVYLTTQFNIKNIRATNIVNISNGGSQLAPLVGAFISDAFLGRFCTISIGSLVSLAASVLLALTAIISSLRPPECRVGDHGGSCRGPSTAQYGILYLYFLLTIVGSGGVSFISSAFGADQFEKESAEGMRQVQTFFNWYYFGLYSSVIVASTVIVYIQSNVSWAWGFGICVVLTAISVMLFFWGTNLYIRARPEGSPFTGLAQVVVACVRKRNLHLPSNSQDFYYGNIMDSAKLPPTPQFRFLNKAAIKTSQDSPDPNPWKLCSVKQVEELKSILKTLPIMSSAIIPNIIASQMMTFAVLQALTMDRNLGPHFQIPAASFIVFGLLSSAIVLPVYDKLIVPFAAGKGVKFTNLQRIGTGMLFYCVGLGVAAVVERKRLLQVKSASMQQVSVSSLWLIPQIVIGGLGDPFLTVGWIDFMYNDFPESLHSTAMGLVSASSAVGFYFSSLLITVIHKNTHWLTDDFNQGRLDYFYALLCGMGVLNVAYFLAWSLWYKDKDHVYAGDQNLSTP
nr:NPF transporter [Taxus x media]